MKRWHALLGGASAVAAFVAARRARREQPIGGVMDHAQTEVYTPEFGVVDDAKVEAPVVAPELAIPDPQPAKPQA